MPSPSYITFKHLASLRHNFQISESRAVDDVKRSSLLQLSLTQFFTGLNLKSVQAPYSAIAILDSPGRQPTRIPTQTVSKLKNHRRSKNQHKKQ